MADRWAVATGNWSSTATWNGGTLPTAADDVYADGFTVTIDQNVTVLSIRTTQRTGGTAGGGFILNGGITFIGDVRAGSTNCLSYTSNTASSITGNIFGSSTTTNMIGIYHAGSLLTITGNINGSNQGNGWGMQIVSGQAIIAGNIFGGSNGSAHGINAFNTPIITVTGNVTGATNNNGNGIFCNSGTATVIINGNAIAGISSTGLAVSGSITLTVNGNIIANSNTIAVSVTSLRLNGIAYSGSTGINAFNATNILVHPTNQLQIEYRVNNSGVPGAARSLFTGGQNLGQPTVANVRAGIAFGVSNEFTGTLIVPSAQFVSLGTPVDSGVGTLQYLTMTDLQSALAPNAPVIAERSDDDTKALTFSWPVSGVPVSGFKSFDNGAYSSVSGAISYLRTEGARHYYTLAYNAADRSTQESLIRYRMQDGTYTKYFNLRIMPATNSEVIAIKAKTDNLPADPASSSQITSLLNNAPMEAF